MTLEQTQPKSGYKAGGGNNPNTKSDAKGRDDGQAPVPGRHRFGRSANPREGAGGPAVSPEVNRSYRDKSGGAPKATPSKHLVK